MGLIAYLDLISEIHGQTPREHPGRGADEDKARRSTVAKQFGAAYFDGDRALGYGGYVYDGRWQQFAHDVVTHYGLTAGDRVLDVGCAKGFLVHDLRVLGIDAVGVDVSPYAIEHAHPPARAFVSVADAAALPFEEASFDLVLSINTLHNLRLPELERALREIGRVGRGRSYTVVDGYRDEREKANLLGWQLTCECFFTPEEWEWLFATMGYAGDYCCVFFV